MGNYHHGCHGVSVLLALIFLPCVFTSSTVGLPKTGLEHQFYKKTNTCDDAEEFIKHQVKIFWEKDRTITPKLIRLLYSDCFVTVVMCLFCWTLSPIQKGLHLKILG